MVRVHKIREAVKSDLPAMNTKQSQCVICWRMFSSDSACELHKPYRKPVTGECKDPSSVGMESKESAAGGFAIWSVPMDPEVKARMEKMWAARKKSVE